MEKTEVSSLQVAMATLPARPEIIKEGKQMAIHHGGKVGKAAKTLASKGSSKTAKSNAGKTLAKHKAKAH